MGVDYDDTVFTRATSFVVEKDPGSPITRANADAHLNELAVGVNAAYQSARLKPLLVDPMTGNQFETIVIDNGDTTHTLKEWRGTEWVPIVTVDTDDGTVTVHVDDALAVLDPRSIDSTVALAAALVGRGTERVRVEGETAAGQARPAEFVRVASQPAHFFRIRSTDRELPASAGIDATNGGWWAPEDGDIGLTLDLNTQDAITTRYIPFYVTSINAAFCASIVDRGGGKLVRVASEPAHTGKRRSLDRNMPDGTTDSGNGGWWELVPGDGEWRLSQFGVTGSGDETTKFDGAVAAAIDSGFPLIIDVNCAINCTRQTLDSTRKCFLILTGDLTIRGRGGVLSSAVTFTSSSIFGIDGTSGTVAFEATDIEVGLGANMHRFVEVTEDGIASTFICRRVKTARQGIYFLGTIADGAPTPNERLVVEDCEVGFAVTATDTWGQSILIALQNPSTSDFKCRIVNNIVVMGTNALDIFALHSLTKGSLVEANIAWNRGGSTAVDAFDFDQLGQGVIVRNNTAIGAPFEVKIGAKTGAESAWLASREIIFDGNICWASYTYAFSLRAPMIAKGNIAFNPNGAVLYLPGTDPGPSDQYDPAGATPLHKQGEIIVDGFRGVWAGAANFSGIRLTQQAGGYARVSLSDVHIVVDAKYKTDQEDSASSAKLPGTLLDIEGGHDHVSLIGFHYDDSAAASAPVSMDGAGASTDLTIADGYIGRATGGLMALNNLTGATIRNIAKDAANTTNPVSFVSCQEISLAEVSMDFAKVIVGSSGVTGLRVNNYAVEAGTTGNPPSVNTYWPIGVLVRITADNTVWLRIANTAVAASDWKQIA